MGEDEIGSTANKYEIVAKLATGGMAEIYLARNESIAGVERYVVLKRVLRRHANDIKFVNMFLDEARLSARLQHPNVAQVYDTGKLGDSYFFTMEYVHGETVRDILRETHATRQLVPVAVALTIIAGAAAGLQHAHERVGFDGMPLGIVHRDVSPSNLMVSYEGNVKLVDFGVAKATHRAHETQTGAVKGKVAYMSPEQIRNTSIDARSDLFSLGIVMWELLVGDRLFKRSGEFETMEAIISDPLPAPSTRRADLRPEIDAIVCKLLEKSPALRFQTANELLEALDIATVRAGLSLSMSSVRRFMRERFGERVEPWLEMARRDAHTDVITITGHVDDARDDDELAAQLDHLLDLSTLLPGTALHPEDDEALADAEAHRIRAAAAISTTSPTVADATRAPTVPPLPRKPVPALRAPEVTTVTVSSAASSAQLAVAAAPPVRWLSPARLLVGGGVAAGAVLAIVLATGDGTAEPSRGSPSRMPRVPPITPAAVAAPPPTPAPEPAPPEPAPTPAAERATAPPTPTPTPTHANRDHPPKRKSAPSPVTRATSKPARPRTADGDEPVDVAPAKPEPRPTANARCDERDPLACRR